MKRLLALLTQQAVRRGPGARQWYVVAAVLVLLRAIVRLTAPRGRKN